MPVELTHIAEDLIAAMLESLAQRNSLDRVVCAVSGRSLSQDIREYGLGESVHFSADDANLVVRAQRHEHACDGEQKVDILCAGREQAIAFEAKLGVTRMGVGEFQKRYCTACEKSTHVDNRISGSMVAVLERSLPFEQAPELVAQVTGRQWRVASAWWLVQRQTIVNSWRKSG